MPPTLRRYLLLEHGLGSALFNFMLNALIAWLTFYSLVEVPLWGQLSIAGDTVGTSIFLPLLTCLIVTPMVRRHIRARHFEAPVWSGLSGRVVAWLPHGTFRRGLLLAVLCVLAIAPATLLLLNASGITTLPLRHFVIFKATFAAALAFVVQPIVALAAFRAPH